MHAFEFDVHVRDDELPPAAPIRYPPAHRAWLHKYLLDLEQHGIVKRVVNVPFASQVVLVPGTMTDLDFRVTVNYRSLNAKIHHSAMTIPDIQGILDFLG